MDLSFNQLCNEINIKFQVHVERGRLTSFLKSAELLKVHGLCDQVESEQTPEEPKKTVIRKAKKNHVPKPVTATISPAFANQSTQKSRNSPKPGPSNQRIESPGIAVKVEEPNYSDEENHPEHVVIPTDPNSMAGGKVKQIYANSSLRDFFFNPKIKYES